MWIVSLYKTYIWLRNELRNRYDKYSNALHYVYTQLINLAYMEFANICVHSIKIIYECLSGAFLFLLGI